MGFAGTLASGWCDWVIADTTIIPPETVSSEVWRDRRRKGQSSVATTLPGQLDPEEKDEDWMYTEKMVYLPNTYFVTDHKQGFRDVPTSGPTDREAAWLMEEQRRWRMRKELFPTLPDNCVIFCCLNQLYKVRFQLLSRRVPPYSSLHMIRSIPLCFKHGSTFCKRCPTPSCGCCDSLPPAKPTSGGPLPSGVVLRLRIASISPMLRRLVS